MKKSIKMMLSAMALILLVACGTGEKDSGASQSGYPLTIANYQKPEGGKDWSPKDQVFTGAPKQVLANTRPVAELLLNLGLKNQIAGVGGVFGYVDETVASDFETLNQLSTTYISKETALSVNPDIVIGRGDLFDNAEWGVGTVDSLNEMGVNTYVFETSIKGGTFDSVYKDIETIGKIFDVPEAADTFEMKLKKRQSEVTAQLKTINQVKTYAYVHAFTPDEFTVYSLEDDTFAQSVLGMLKLEHAFTGLKEYIAEETFIENNPDVLIIPKVGSTEEAQKEAEAVVESIYANPKFTNMKALKDKAIYIVDYNHLFGYGYQSLDGVEKLAKEMYPTT